MFHFQIDMDEIAHAYKSKYGKKLSDELKSECGGDYLKMLLAIVTPQE